MPEQTRIPVKEDVIVIPDEQVNGLILDPEHYLPVVLDLPEVTFEHHPEASITNKRKCYHRESIIGYLVLQNERKGFEGTVELPQDSRWHTAARRILGLSRPRAQMSFSIFDLLGND